MQPESLPPKERALLDAARNDDLARVKELLGQGAVVDARDNLEIPWGQTPLMYAATNGNASMVRLLIESGADITAKDQAPRGEGGGQNALHYATRSKNPVVINLLLNAADSLGAKIIDAVDAFGSTHLNIAIDNSNNEAVRILLERGFDVRKKPRGKKFEPPIYAAARGGSLEIVRLLLEAGAEVNVPNELGQTALNSAASLKNGSAVELIELLVKAGATVDHADLSGDTPFVMALLHKNCPAVKALAAAGANVNQIIKSQGGTPLDVAEKRMKAAKATAENSSEPAWAREKSSTSFGEWKEMVELLIGFGAKRKSEL